jgi:hypothetical protein
MTPMKLDPAADALIIFGALGVCAGKEQTNAVAPSNNKTVLITLPYFNFLT